jgi:ATP-dependent phosphofructokinase / diphosphate-dependent phosphofructokinase
MTKRVGILTGGGDAPGLNAVIRAFVKRGAGQLGWSIIGIEDSFNGLLDQPKRVLRLEPRSCQGLLHRGGTMLGTTNHGDPFAYPMPDGSVEDRSSELASTIRREGLEGLVILGGDGTQAIGHRLSVAHGIPVVGVPKTIDNDLAATDLTFGFVSAVDCATDALDRLHSTAESHERIMLLEVMGRDAGHIALWAGIAGGADVILIPEIPYDPERVADKIRRRQSLGRLFTIIIVAEGALPAGPGVADLTSAERKARLQEGGGASVIAMKELAGRVTHEMRNCVLGHLQRGGSPVAFDRVLATRFGVRAADLVDEGRWGEMVCLRNGKIESVKIADVAERYRTVDPDGDIVRAARAVGTEFGASQSSAGSAG